MRIIIIILFALAATTTLAKTKYELWQTPSFFRGFNLLNDEHSPKSLEDFQALQKTGANFAYLNIWGDSEPVSPYDENAANVAAADSMVAFCRQTGLYYALTVRSGPGRQDVYLEGEDIVPPSTIWTSLDEQKLYASMIKRMTQRYSSDSLFVGISPILEPNPLFDKLYINHEMLAGMLENANINLTNIYSIIIDSIRTIDEEIPVIVQNVAYSSPEFIPILEAQSDDKVIYELHSYKPREVVKADSGANVEYPGLFLYFGDLTPTRKYYNRTFIRDTLFAYMRDFAAETGSPVLLGEFGMQFEQKGGVELLQDYSAICKELGWHFAYWDWRTNRGRGAWDYEKKKIDYLNAIKASFIKISGVDSENAANDVFSAFWNYRNETVILEIRKSGRAEISVFDLLGTEMRFEREEFLVGENGAAIEKPLSTLNPGFYMIKLKIGEYKEFEKLIIY